MSFLMRWFSADYRAGLGAEATGDLTEAARRFAACGRDADLARVQRLQVAEFEDHREAVVQARRALATAERADSPRYEFLATLAEALSQLASRQAGAEGEATYREFAKLCSVLDWSAQAGEVLNKIGDYEAAADAFATAGDIDAMNVALGKHRMALLGGVERSGLTQRVMSLLSAGRAKEAIPFLANADDTLRRAVEARLPKPYFLTLKTDGEHLHLCSLPRIEVGRELGLPLTINVASVSRRHISIERESEGLLITDLGSRSGTLRGSIYLVEPLKITAESTIWLGSRCALRLQPKGKSWQITASVDGVAGSPLVLGVECDDPMLYADERWWLAGQRILCVGDQVGVWTVV